MNGLTLQGQKIASETYTRAYQTGQTPLTYRLPHIFQSFTIGAMDTDYPSQTAEVFPGVDTGADTLPEYDPNPAELEHLMSASYGSDENR
jgi:hypothetical protein